MSTLELQQWDKQYLWHPFAPQKLWQQSEPLVIERAEGMYLYDTDGHKYLDGVSSIWCNVHGHNHPYINQALRMQLDKLDHSTMLGLTSKPAVRLAKKLVEVTPEGLNKVFYSDSGATAVEIALKMAFQYWRNIGQERRLFIGLKQAYHGDTIGTVSVGGIEAFHKIFGPLTFKALFVDYPHPYRFEGSEDECRESCLQNLEQILQQHVDQVAAIITEPLVQGAAGIIVHPEGFLRGVRELTQKHNVLMITDEVATGFGRTGTMFACEQEAVAPDLMCLAKGITGGYLPLAATLANDRVHESFIREPWWETTFYHGHTYTGNPLGCATAIASLEVFEQEQTLAGLPHKFAVMQKYLDKIQKLEYVGHARRRGMMAGIELVRDKDTRKSFDYPLRIGAGTCDAMRPEGLILRPLGDVVVLMPPLAISINQLEEMMQIIHDTIAFKLPEIVKSAAK